VRTERSRVLATTRERIWDVVGDPWHEPRWWPRVQRVEGVTRRGWTSVMVSDRGRTVRADWSVEASERPARRRWRQELAGSPFERIFTAYAVEVALQRVEGGTEVRLRVDQQPRGMGRVLPWTLRRAMRRQLDTALDGLAAAVEDPA
jgi:uncharacterized protein YndB with AHSA1/START domain